MFPARWFVGSKVFRLALTTAIRLVTYGASEQLLEVTFGFATCCAAVVPHFWQCNAQQMSVQNSCRTNLYFCCNEFIFKAKNMDGSIVHQLILPVQSSQIDLATASKSQLQCWVLNISICWDQSLQPRLPRRRGANSGSYCFESCHGCPDGLSTITRDGSFHFHASTMQEVTPTPTPGNLVESSIPLQHR